MRSLEQLDLWITAKIKAWSSKALGAPQSMELLEIRREILNDVRDHIQPKGNGQNSFPYNTVSMEIAAENSAQQKELEAAFSQDNEDWEQTISALLSEAGCPLPAGFHVAVSVIEDPTLAVTTHPFQIHYSHVKAIAGPAASRQVRPNGKLTVLSGQADPAEYTIKADRTNLGRLKEVISEKDGLRRRNDVAFAEGEITVSREHAYIRYHPETGQFRLYDSVSQRGTSVFRDGRRFTVPKGPTRGFQLRSGDEIHLGEASLQFVADEA